MRGKIMSLTSTNELAFERTMRQAVSSDALQQHLEVFSTLFRDSGSEDEWKAARYIADTLRGYGVDAKILEFDSLISWPLAGRLALLDDSGREVEEITVRTRAFGGQTAPGGLEAELVFVPFAAPEQGAMIFSHRAVAGDYTGLDVAGKIVLTMDGGPDGIRRAEERGAAGHIHLWPSDEPVVHEMIGTSVWGTPTRESARRLPRVPSFGVSHADGQRLAEHCRAGTVRVRAESNVKTEWMRVPLVTGFIPGAASDDFLLVGAHIDSWYEGITDNATGDAALLEMARVLSAGRAGLRRGVRFGWWPGHSTGRYSGSTWFVDNHFAELRAHAVGYLNIDSPGVKGTEIFDCRYNCGEIEHVTRDVVGELSGQEPNIRRPLRAGDQSFLGVGLPSLGAFRMLPVEHADRKAVGGSGGAWWWHSPADTLDKADAGVLAADVQIYVTIAARMCVPPVIPYRFVPAAQDFIERLSAYQEAAGDRLDLTGVTAAAQGFKAAAERLDASDVTGDAVGARNDGLKRLSRTVNSALFTVNGPYEMDPALQLPILPGLAPAAQLASLEPRSDEYHFLRTELVRQRNRVEDALLEATRLAGELAR
ncbi:MAG TPA: M28 family peptidase [Thermomicrobiaceae bacterium]|nr:M28 family peptidase [Thermomicrobiaceae bacterium]